MAPRSSRVMARASGGKTATIKGPKPKTPVKGLNLSHHNRDLY